MQISNNMQISELYKKNPTGEKLKKFFKALIENPIIAQTLRNRDSYDSGKLRIARESPFGRNLSLTVENYFKSENLYLSLTVENYFKSENLYLRLKAENDLTEEDYLTNKELEDINSSFVSPFGQNLIKYPDKIAAEVIDMTVKECPSAKLEDILQCSDFINAFNGQDSKTKNQLNELLSQHKDMNYEDIKYAVEVSLRSIEDKKIFFAKVLPAYDFKVCNEFDSTWDMFKNGYIDFDTLVTKFWKRDDFDKDQNNTDRQNEFQTFADGYSRCLNNNEDENALHALVTYANGDNTNDNNKIGMIDVLKNKQVISENDVQNLKNQIGKATDVTIFGVIIQFFANLFSKGKIARKANFKLEQDRAISNLKPLSGLLRQTTIQRMDDSDKLL